MGFSRRTSTPLLSKAAPLTLLLAPTLAHAHPGHHSHGFASGFGHPLHGWDHLLAMVAVGIWAAQRGGRARWILPLTFVATMVLGGALGVAGVGLPGAEAGILASVLVLGGLIAAAARLPLWGACTLVAAFALFHGHAHGTEMAPDLSGMSYGLGFASSTALLHVAGVALPIFLRRLRGDETGGWVRLAGAGIGVAGLVLFVGG